MDKVPWGQMRVMSIGWGGGRIRTKDEHAMCPIAAVTGNPEDTGTPHTAAARIGLGASVANRIINAADFANTTDPKAAELRAEMLRRMEAAR